MINVPSALVSTMPEAASQQFSFLSTQCEIHHFKSLSVVLSDDGVT